MPASPIIAFKSGNHKLQFMAQWPQLSFVKELTMSTRLPTYFISHGGGPWPYMDDMRQMLLGLRERMPKPRIKNSARRELGRIA